jgi:hypothetical protein
MKKQLKFTYPLAFSLICFFITMTGFSQQNSNSKTGLNTEKSATPLKVRATKDTNISPAIATIQQVKLSPNQQQTTKSGANRNLTDTSVPTKEKMTSAGAALAACEQHYYRDGYIRILSNPDYNNNGVKINTLTNVTFQKWTNSTNGVLSYEWKIYNSNGTLLDTKNTTNFPITLTEIGQYTVKLKLTDALGCSEHAFTVKVRDSNPCIIPAEERVGSINTPEYRDEVLANSASVITFSPSGYQATGFSFKWDLYDANNTRITTGDQKDFSITPPAIAEYRLNLRITDPDGCITDYTKTIKAVDQCTYTENDRQVSIVAQGEYQMGNVTQLNIGQSTVLSPSFSRGWNGTDPYTYSWKLYAPNGTPLKEESGTTFSIDVTEPGYYKVTLDVTFIATGCVSSTRKIVNGLIQNGCANTNEKSTEIKNLYVNFLKKLIVRAVLGETDEQINATVASPEFMALKPYIKNGIGDKIYNFVSTRANDKVNGFNFSFSPERDYDVHIYSIFGVDYDPEYNSLEELNNNAESIIYTDIKQYISTDTYFPSCFVPTYSKTKTQNKVVLGPHECGSESEVRNIDFCPAAPCTPITGVLKITKTPVTPNPNPNPNPNPLPTTAYQYEGLWQSNDIENQPEINAWVDYLDASGVQQRMLIGASTNGCKEIMASSIVNTNGVETCLPCIELPVTTKNPELCYNITYMNCTGEIKTHFTAESITLSGKKIISVLQQDCNSTDPPPTDPPAGVSKIRTRSNSKK